ncbi:hypothetical protein [Mycolicibacterium fortuitum]|uniref:hypothetical protein n=1 Tax=Mycolicibacterium fortuitum TaxID=1766 RepID=UPI002601F71E|nr:hypothetical protein [Mycolicibacterium fortuitum]
MSNERAANLLMVVVFGGWGAVQLAYWLQSDDRGWFGLVSLVVPFGIALIGVLMFFIEKGD